MHLWSARGLLGKELSWWTAVTLTKAQRTAVQIARGHPRHLVEADPRVEAALLEKGIAKVTHYGEGMDGPIYRLVLVDGGDDV